VIPEPPSPLSWLSPATAGEAVLAQAMNATTVAKVAVRIWWMRWVFMVFSLVG
jgi:hypothetical protein